MNRIERLEMCEAFRQVAADCIQRRHAAGPWLANTQPEAMNDATLTEAVKRLRAWLDGQPPLPIHPDSHRARHGA